MELLDPVSGARYFAGGSGGWFGSECAAGTGGAGGGGAGANNSRSNCNCWRRLIQEVELVQVIIMDVSWFKSWRR